MQLRVDAYRLPPPFPPAADRLPVICHGIAQLQSKTSIALNLLGADVSQLSPVDEEDFRDAQWDDASKLHPEMNTSIMIYVPEPGGTLSLAVGVFWLAIFGRSRSRG